MTRFVADSPTIGVCCGHRVPRIPRMINGWKRVYWCEECGAWKMSGGKVTGLSGHAWLFELRDLVARAGVVVDLPSSAPDHGRRTVLALGAELGGTRRGTQR